MPKSKDAFRTISEVADWLDLEAHVLRFWESKFTQVKPLKRAGGRRYYRPNDMLLLGGIKQLLHEDGLTIKGVQKLLRDEGVKHVSAFSRALPGQPEGAKPAKPRATKPKAAAKPKAATNPKADLQKADPNQLGLPFDSPAPAQPAAPSAPQAPALQDPVAKAKPDTAAQPAAHPMAEISAMIKARNGTPLADPDGKLADIMARLEDLHRRMAAPAA